MQENTANKLFDPLFDSEMSVIEINKASDPFILPYRNLKDKQLRRDYGIFVAEGEHLVRRLVESPLEVESMLLLKSRLKSLSWAIPSSVKVYVTDQATMSKITGFPFHRGVLAIGRRLNQKFLNEVLSDRAEANPWIICPEINNVENLGSLIRTGTALGYENFLLGPSCCDPFARRALRTAMGATFSINLVYSANLYSDLLRLKSNNFELHAAVLAPSAVPLERAKIPHRLGLLFGSEAHGLAQQWQELCDQHVTIPMFGSSDSLNITVAAGILLYHYARKRSEWT